MESATEHTSVSLKISNAMKHSNIQSVALKLISEQSYSVYLFMGLVSPLAFGAGRALLFCLYSLHLKVPAHVL